MNKSDLVDVIVEGARVSKGVAGKVLEDILHAITAALSKGEDVTLVGFGTFCTRNRKARIGRNPQTGKALQIEARKVATFKAGKLLKDTVQKNKES